MRTLVLASAFSLVTSGMIAVAADVFGELNGDKEVAGCNREGLVNEKDCVCSQIEQERHE